METSPHGFRHGFDRDYILNGGDLVTLSYLMGHTNMSVTRDSYAVFLFRELKQKHAQHSQLLRIMDVVPTHVLNKVDTAMSSSTSSQ